MRNTDTLTLQEYTFEELGAKFEELNSGALLAINLNDLASLNSLTKSLELVRAEQRRRFETQPVRSNS